MCELMCVSASASAARTTSTLTYNASSVRLVNNREVNVEDRKRGTHFRLFSWSLAPAQLPDCPLCLDQDSNQKMVNIAHLDTPLSHMLLLTVRINWINI